MPGAIAAVGARQDKGIRRPAVRSARQARVCFSDDFAVLEVQCPGFRQQLANTCEPASGLGGTIGEIRRLHDEAP
uniref:Uncharacterized protein n=1 Tax=Burkholderia orbicola (strain AU 1054) TaxID=331271 RepID=A0A0H2XW98_BURO1